MGLICQNLEISNLFSNFYDRHQSLSIIDPKKTKKTKKKGQRFFLSFFPLELQLQYQMIFYNQEAISINLSIEIICPFIIFNIHNESDSVSGYFVIFIVPH